MMSVYCTLQKSCTWLIKRVWTIYQISVDTEDWPNKIYFFMCVIMRFTENIKHTSFVISRNSFGYTIFITITCL